MTTQEHPQVAAGRKLEEEIRNQEELELNPDSQDDSVKTEDSPEDNDNPFDENKHREATPVDEEVESDPDSDEEGEEQESEKKADKSEGVDPKGLDKDQLLNEYKRINHKYKTLDGIIRSKDLKINDLENALFELQKTVSNIEKGRKDEEKKKVEDKTNFDLQSLREEYGNDYVDSMMKLARIVADQMVDERVPGIEKEISDLKNNVKTMTEQEKKQVRVRFEQDLVKSIPNFMEQNTDPEFIDWLRSEKIGPTNITMMDALNNAIQNLDVPGVSEIFGNWRDQNSKGSEEDGAKKSSMKRKSELENQVQPGKTKNTPVNTTEKSNPTITRKYIADFWAKVSKGEFKDREEERRKIEQKIDEAMYSGKIVT